MHHGCDISVRVAIYLGMTKYATSPGTPGKKDKGKEGKEEMKPFNEHRKWNRPPEVYR